MLVELKERKFGIWELVSNPDFVNYLAAVNTTQNKGLQVHKLLTARPHYIRNMYRILVNYVTKHTVWFS